MSAGSRIPVIVLPEEHSKGGVAINLSLIPFFNDTLGQINRAQVLNFSEGEEINDFFNKLHGKNSTISMIEQKDTQPDIETFKEFKMALAFLNILERELDGFRDSKIQNPAYIFKQIDGEPATENYLQKFMLQLYKMQQVYPVQILSRINTAWIDIFRGGERDANYEPSIELLLEDLATHFAGRDNTLFDFRQMITDLQVASKSATPTKSRTTVNLRYRGLIRKAIDIRNIRKIEAFVQSRNANPDPSKHVVLVIMDVGLNHYQNLSKLITESQILIREPTMTNTIEQIYTMAKVSLVPRERARKSRRHRNRRKTRKIK